MEEFMSENLRKVSQIECELLKWKIDTIMSENLVIEREYENLKKKFYLVEVS